MTRVLALVLTAFLVAGCDVLGSTKKAPPPKPLSHAQFVRAADRACRRANRRAKRLKKVTSAEAFLFDLKLVIPIFEGEIGDLRPLAPPRADAARFQQMLSTLDAEDLLANHLLLEFESRHIRSVKGLAKRLDVIGKHSNRLARKLGLTVCAK